MAADPLDTTTPGVEEDEKSLLEQKKKRDEEEDLKSRTELGENELKQRFKSVFGLIHEQVFLDRNEEKSSILSKVEASSNEKVNLRDEKAYRIMTSALGSLPFLRRHISKDVIFSLLKEEGVINEEGDLTKEMAEFDEEQGFINLFLDLLNEFPNRNLVVPKPSKEEVKQKEIEENKKKAQEELKSKKDKVLIKKPEAEKKDAGKENEADKKKEATLATLIVEAGEAARLMLALISITSCVDVLAGKGVETINQEDNAYIPDEGHLLSVLEEVASKAKTVAFKLLLEGQLAATDMLISRVYYWVVISKTKLGQLNDPEFINELGHVHGLATNQRLVMTQATVLNAQLRLLITVQQDWKRSDHVVRFSQFPIEAARTTQHCRYLFYKAVVMCNVCSSDSIRPIEDANALLICAMRKAPSGQRGVGIKLEIARMIIITDLLIGKPNSKAAFDDPSVGPHLAIYRQIATAVRGGMVQDYQKIIALHAEELRVQGPWTLIRRRLTQACVRSSLINIARTYSRIAMEDVQSKIGMDDKPLANTYSILAQAISDGMLPGVTVDGEKGFFLSEPTAEKVGSSKKFIADLNLRTSELNALHIELKEALARPMDEGMDDEAKLQAAERARKEAQESLLRAQDAYYEDFDF